MNKLMRSSADLGATILLLISDIIQL